MLEPKPHWIGDSEYLAAVRAKLLKIAVAKAGQVEDAEDLVQDALQALIEQASKKDLQTTPLRYAIGILKYKMGQRRQPKDMGRREGWGEPAGSFESPEESLYMEELRAALRRAMASLHRPCQRIFALLHLGLTPSELQAKIGAPNLAALKSRVHRCRKKLRRFLVSAGFLIDKAEADLTLVGQCTDPEVGLNLSFYEAGVLEKEEREAFERHLSECTDCALELYDLYEAVEIIREEARRLLLYEGQEPGALERKLFGPRRPLPLPEDMAALMPFQQFYHSFVPRHWKFLICFLVAVIAYGGYVFFTLPQRPPTVVAPLFLLPEMPPTLEFSVEARQRPHLAAGFDLYRQKRFLEALRAFVLSAEREGPSWERSFFVGVANLYAGNAQAVAGSLRSVTGEAGRHEPLVRWYLAAAFWDLGNPDDALAELETIVKLDAAFAGEARQLLRRIKVRRIKVY